MTERTNRRDDIIKAAACLFIEQGYAATSVREIAEAVGVTEAALYYHFKEGKRALLHAVLESKTPEMITILEGLDGATSLDDLMVRFGQSIQRMVRRLQGAELLRWLIAEYHRFAQSERDIIREKQEMLHQNLAQHVVRFVPTPQDADRLAWMLLCAAVGYEQLFIGMGYLEHKDFPPDAMVMLLRRMVTGAPLFDIPSDSEGISLMRVMITIDHPWKDSFNHAIMTQIVAVLEQGGHTVDVLDLHDEDFDPVLHVHELADYGKGIVHDPKVLDYQARIKQATHLIYIFPVWWEVMPALLKGFFDKVFTPTFAFNEADFSPLLGHVKTGSAITTMGAPEPIHTSVEPVLCKGILEATGVQQSFWINLADMPHSTPESRQAWVERILAHVRRLA